MLNGRFDKSYLRALYGPRAEAARAKTLAALAQAQAALVARVARAQTPEAVDEVVATYRDHGGREFDRQTAEAVGAALRRTIAASEAARRTLAAANARVTKRRTTPRTASRTHRTARRRPAAQASDTAGEAGPEPPAAPASSAAATSVSSPLDQTAAHEGGAA